MKSLTTPKIALLPFVLLLVLVVLVTAAFTTYFVRIQYQRTATTSETVATTTIDAAYSEIHQWTHNSGTVLAEKVRPAKIEFEGTPKEKITPGKKLLTSTSADGVTTVLTDEEIPNPYIGAQSITEVEFSPNGTYVTIFADGYEATIIETYNLKTGKPLPLVSGASAYWSQDGTKVAFLADNSPIAGPLATLLYVGDGMVENAKVVKVFDDRVNNGEQSFVKNILFTSNTLEFDIQDFSECDAEGVCHGDAEKFRFDMALGTLEAVGGYSF